MLRFQVSFERLQDEGGLSLLEMLHSELPPPRTFCAGMMDFGTSNAIKLWQMLPRITNPEVADAWPNLYFGFSLIWPARRAPSKIASARNVLVVALWNDKRYVEEVAALAGADIICLSECDQVKSVAALGQTRVLDLSSCTGVTDFSGLVSISKAVLRLIHPTRCRLR